MRSVVACMMLVAGFLVFSIPHAGPAIPDASRLAGGIDLIVVCGAADDRALGEHRTALVIRSCWLSGLFGFGVRVLGTALKAAVGALVAVLT